MSEKNQSGRPLQKGYKPIGDEHHVAGYKPGGNLDPNPPQGGSGVPAVDPSKKPAKKD